MWLFLQWATLPYTLAWQSKFQPNKTRLVHHLAINTERRTSLMQPGFSEYYTLPQVSLVESVFERNRASGLGGGALHVGGGASRLVSSFNPTPYIATLLFQPALNPQP